VFALTVYEASKGREKENNRITMEPTGILHVDDSEDDRFLFKRAWQRAGIHLALVSLSSGEDAIDYLAGNGEYADRGMYPIPCIVFLDLKMNGTSGFDVLRWLRDQPALQHLVVIVYSSSNHSVDVQQSLKLGANAFVTKPAGNGLWEDFLLAVKNFWLRFHEFPWPSNCKAPLSDTSGANANPPLSPKLI
jgi:CheY-like chemotaxis protein